VQFIVKIKVSYEDPNELVAVLKRLGTMANKPKYPREQTGKYMKAYIEIKPDKNL
jgi:hypothetical protein